MRPSTIIISCITAAVVIAVAAASVFQIANAMRRIEYVISSDNPITVELAPFDKVNISTILGNIRTHHYKGVVIEENDSLKAPCLQTPHEWTRYITYTVKDSTLSLVFNYSPLKDSLKLRETTGLYVESEIEKPIKLIVPRRMVKEAVTDQYNIYFDKFRGGTIKASVFKRDLYITTDDSYHLQHVDIYPGWLMVNEGYLDSVIAQTPLEGLRLYKATVDDAFLPMGKYHCTVTCKQPGDSVINLHLLADSVHKPGELNLSTAHIRHLWFPPRDSANMAINLTLTRPIDIAYH